MKRRVPCIFLSFLAVLWQASCDAPRSAPAPAPRAELDPGRLSGTNALEEVRRFVALGLRDSGTPGAERAAEYLAGRLRALGLEPVVDAFKDRSPKGETTFRNVTATVPGTAPGLIVLGSHYDTKAGLGPAFEGANDSGSSTGLLLELGRLLVNGPRERPAVMLAFFDGEECMVDYGPFDGLHGSRRLAAELKRTGQAAAVQAVIILDMIGDRDLSVTLPRNATPDLRTRVFHAAREEGIREKFALGSGPILDDHVPFLERGMPAVDIIDFQFGSAPGRNDYWHTTADSMDKLSAESLERVGRVVVRVLNTLPAHGSP
ncbi:MAG: M28 family peptidase [Kiritimatiellae bacterium]|nr:M28 family peptidase [Kiritimatiellia bacterium]